MDENLDYEIFSQQGKCYYCIAKDGKIISVTEENLVGIAIREVNSTYQKMLSTTSGNMNIERIVKMLGQYARNVFFLNENEKKGRKKNGKLNKEREELCRSLSFAAMPLRCSFVFVDSQKEVRHVRQKERISCSREKYAFWAAENPEDATWMRSLAGAISWEKPFADLELIRQEKESALLPMREISGAGQMCVLFAKEASCALYHEIIGHVFEAGKARNNHCFSDGCKKKLIRYPLNVSDECFASPSDALPIVDDEGTKKSCTRMLSNGFSETLLTDRRNRPFELALTGNCRRSSIYFFPEPRMYRIRVQPGCSSISEMIRRIPDAYLVTSIYMGRFDHKSGMVWLYAYVSAKITEGICCPQKMCILIKDTIVNFFNGISEISDASYCKGIHCVSGSGPLYTEAESPDTVIQNIYVERIWIL